jgi:uncharacterized membrane protein SpoIIM required for sporulation
MNANQTSDDSIRDIASRLSGNLSELMRKEIDLGKAELTQKFRHLSIQVAALAIGGAVLYAGLLVLLAAAVLGLSTVLSPWLSALLIGAVVSLIGVALLLKGKKGLAEQDVKPTQTVRSVQRDFQVMKEAMQ